MKYSNYARLILLIFIICILLTSCVSKTKIRKSMIYKDDSYVYDHLKKHGLLIGGISSEYNKINFNKRLKYSALLSKILKKDFKK